MKRIISGIPVECVKGYILPNRYVIHCLGPFKVRSLNLNFHLCRKELTDG